MAEDIAVAPETADPAALSLALAGASREEADAFLRDQRHHIHEQLRQIHLDIFEKWLGVLLRMATLVVGLGIAAALAIALWAGSHAEGTVVDAFSVPSQFAQAGVTGEVVASDLTGMMDAIRNQIASNSPSNTQEVRQDRTEDIKVEIPETGVSLGQAWRYLRLWLGHERHLSGNLRLSGNGKAVLTVTSDGARIASVSGASADLDRLEQQAAEQIFAKLDPHNMVLYLRTTGRVSESLAAAERDTNLAVSLSQRADAHSLWAALIRSMTGDVRGASAHTRIAAALHPQSAAIRWEFMSEALLLGHDETALHQARLLPSSKQDEEVKSLQGRGFERFLAEGRFERSRLQGDFAQAATGDECLICSRNLRALGHAEYAALAHDMAASHALVEEASTSRPQVSNDWRSILGADVAKVRYYWNANTGNWPAAAASARVYQANIRANPALSAGVKALILPMRAQPLLAIALAKSGDVAGAQAAIAATPQDCYDCIRTRGVIAAAAQQWSRADGWFARAVHDAPSIPFAYHDWGMVLLARGKPDDAIAQFKLANQKGPHFADPLEGWGEALMAKNQSHLALAKFAEAEKYAPNWGRLHLKWGEALGFAGKPAEAKAQLARAAALDLTPSEKSELAKNFLRLNHV
jgi:tetratricopeptide (TPR) repeat protein